MNEFSQVSVNSKKQLSFMMLFIATCSLWSYIFLKSDLVFNKKGWGAVVYLAAFRAELVHAPCSFVSAHI